MNNNQKQSIQELRMRGISYAQIADKVGLSANSVKSFCRRYNVGQNICKNCDKPLVNKAKRKPKTFCGDGCRHAWWKINRHLAKKNAVKHFICVNCHEEFAGYGKRNRKYCTRGCYIAYRYGVP